jgi:uncharacterized protein YecA (UPF0149 family)
VNATSARAALQNHGSAARRPDDGDTIRNAETPIGRNDPCPCGSGKKHKKCCGK